MSEEEFLGKTPVKNAFDEARVQLNRYADALDERCGQQVRLKSYRVVSIGFERPFGEEVTLV